MRLFGPPDSDKYAYHKLGDGDLEWVNKLEYTSYPGGVMHFHEVFDIDQSKVLPYLDELAYVPSCGLEIVKDADGNLIGGKTFEGKDVDISDLLKLPMRVGGHGEPEPVNSATPEDIREFFEHVEETFYMALVRYCDIYQMVTNTLLWRMRGHALRYSPGANLGIHNDNDTNTLMRDGQRWESGRDIAMFQVTNGLAYFNDDYEGGEFRFPYLNLTIKPKTGDIILFPANYIGTHGVTPIVSGHRYSYLTQFGHGGGYKYEVTEPNDSNCWLPPVWMPFLAQDVMKFSQSPYSHYDSSEDKRLGFPFVSYLEQEREPEGSAVGEKIEYGQVIAPPPKQDEEMRQIWEHV